MSFDVRDYIVVLENIISDELCKEILTEYGNDRSWINTVTGTGLTRDIRRCDAINMSDSFIIQQNEERRKSIDKQIFDCAANAIKQYNEKFNHARIEGDSGYTLLRYQEGEFYKEHTDHFLQAPRSVSCSFALNDDYEGGEWGFFNREIVIKVPKGSAVMFPSNFMYPHEILPVTRRVRFSIITWFI
jgi:hypothetical protein